MSLCHKAIATAGFENAVQANSEHCKGRHFTIRVVTGVHMEEEDDHFWWQNSEWTTDRSSQLNEGIFFPTRPERMKKGASICVPAECGKDEVAAWIVPLLMQKVHDLQTVDLFSKQAPHLNESHLLLPPPLSFHLPMRQFPEVWACARATLFTLVEYIPMWTPNAAHCNLLLALLLPMSVCGLLTACGGSWPWLQIFSPQQHFRDLARSRGSISMDVCRVLCTVAVVSCHALVRGRWRDFPEGSTADFLRKSDRIYPRVQTTFLVLAVTLCTEKVSKHPLASERGWRFLLRWPIAVLRYALRRLATLLPLVLLWTYAYLHIWAADLPLNHILDLDHLRDWYGHRKAICSRTPRLWSSVLLVHGLVFGHSQSNLCHNLSAFEGMWHVDVAVFAMATLLGSGRAASWIPPLLWPLAVGMHYMAAGELSAHKSHPVAGHRFLQLWPSALLTIVLLRWLPPRRTKFLFRRSLTAEAVCLLAVLSIVATAVHDWKYIYSKLAYTKPSWEFFCYAHFMDLPHVLGVFLLLRWGDQGAADDESTKATEQVESQGNLFHVLARLCFGVTIAHIFVIDFVVGFLHDEPLELTVVNLLGSAFSYLVLSLGVALSAHLTVAAPCSKLLQRFVF
ncbi:unnamed protein product [Polarella glacialis]|uniref:Acyltransferase 3 domain-containing protein n=1 Tax=Polarella glacialis TaxID=89957 RepID=A0A813G045_POLGL|nr:unnamed protein product [Polarella glacialis]